MEDKVVLVDTSVLIDYYRKTDKNKSLWVNLIDRDYSFAISAITKYEIYTGVRQDQLPFWNKVLQNVILIPFDENCVDIALGINTKLKQQSKQIDLADLFIAATAIANNLSIATLNLRHFERIEDLKILK